MGFFRAGGQRGTPAEEKDPSERNSECSNQQRKHGSNDSEHDDSPSDDPSLPRPRNSNVRYASVDSTLKWIFT